MSTVSEDEVTLARALVNPDVKIRHKTVEALKSYLTSNESFSDLDMLKLWKALYYCYWSADKVPVQMELAQKLAKLLRMFPKKNRQSCFSGCS